MAHARSGARARRRQLNVPLHIEIWSDIVCPFCYIGKRNLEAALAQFSSGEPVTVTWKSFELDPSTERAGKSLYERLAEKYGQSVEWARESSAQITKTAAAVGLDFHLNRAVPANTFNAHRLLHLAAKHGLADAAEERFMTAYFTEGKDIGDSATLAALAADAGLPADEVNSVLGGDDFADDVRRDLEEARAVGVSAVPFFIFNRKVAVRGAQPVSVFLSALHQVETGVKPG